MSQITTEAAAGHTVAPHRRRNTLIVGVAAVVGVAAFGGGALAVADGLGVWRSDGMVHIETQNLDVIYRGQRISQEALQSLNDQGRGLFTVTDVDTASDLNATRAFDTQGELDAYSAAYQAWQKNKREQGSAPPWGIAAPPSWSPGKP